MPAAVSDLDQSPVDESGLGLAKGHGAADWSQRPLPETWLNYAALDVEDYPTAIRMVFDFKSMLYRSADLPIALKIVEGLWLRTVPHIHLLYPAPRDTRMGVRCHRDAVSALRAGDAPGVRTAMQRDLIEHRLILLDILTRAALGSEASGSDASGD